MVGRSEQLRPDLGDINASLCYITEGERLAVGRYTRRGSWQV